MPDHNTPVPDEGAVTAGDPSPGIDDSAPALGEILPHRTQQEHVVTHENQHHQTRTDYHEIALSRIH